MCVFIFVVLSRDPHSTLCVHYDHIQYSKHKRTHIYDLHLLHTQTTGCQEGQGRKYACVCLCVSMFVGGGETLQVHWAVNLMQN